MPIKKGRHRASLFISATLQTALLLNLQVLHRGEVTFARKEMTTSVPVCFHCKRDNGAGADRPGFLRAGPASWLANNLSLRFLKWKMKN